jgi:hypothetical protein
LRRIFFSFFHSLALEQVPSPTTPPLSFGTLELDDFFSFAIEKVGKRLAVRLVWKIELARYRYVVRRYRPHIRVASGIAERASITAASQPDKLRTFVSSSLYWVGVIV